MSIKKLLSPAGGENRYIVGDEWGQGRTAFGGATAAIMCHSVLSLSASDKSPISFSATFCAPVKVEIAIDVEVEALRRGKTLDQFAVRAVQDGRLCAHAVAVFGAKIDSSISIPADSAPKLTKEIADAKQKFAIGVNPRFEENFDFRFYKGAPLYSGSTEREHLVGIAYKELPSSWSLAHLVCLMDACPPTQAQQLKEYNPLSTVVWNIHFLPQVSGFDLAEGCIMSSFGESSYDGLNYLSERVWSHEGKPLAFSTQSLLIFG